MQNNNHPPIHINSNSDTAILCLHGLCGSPNQFIPLITTFQALKIDVYAPILPGHGGTARDFGRSTKNEWKEVAKSAILELKDKYKNIYLMGHSMGGLFCIDYAELVHANGIILINPPMKINISYDKLKMCLKVILKKKEANKSSNPIQQKKIHHFANSKQQTEIHNSANFKQPKEVNNSANSEKSDQMLTTKQSRPLYSIANGHWYEYIPWIVPMLSMYPLIHESKKLLANLRTPTLIFQSKLDETLNYKGAYLYQKAIDSEYLKLIFLEHSYHCYFPIEDLNILRTLTTQFIETNSF
ncbi:MAG: hypothetical protein ATN31_02185 [Candidatus Epulonipiscioides saccharophilum]|nr:MAG: hypothetical protein ATN31_02185 [Epulopiscium sp. AS2M-Bin001]